MNSDKQIIIGIHSIAAALKNTQRQHILLMGTDEGFSELKKKGNIGQNSLEKIEKVTTMTPQNFNQEAARLYQKHTHTFTRIPSGCLLYSVAIPEKNSNWAYDMIITKGECRLLCLDNITDVHNGAAIMRTAAFYGIDAIVIAGKGSFGHTPAFTRIASGALEYLPIVRVGSLPKFLTKLISIGVECVGLSEHAEHTDLPPNKLRCLVMGAEDVGLSHAVSRILTHMVALKPQGPIKSLNVSVASAIAIERYL